MATPVATPVSTTAVPAAPAPAAAPAGACLARAAAVAANPAEADAEPCTSADELDLDGDGLKELTISCQLGMKSWKHVVYRQATKGCYVKLAELEGMAQVMAEDSITEGFHDLSVAGEDGEPVLLSYAAARGSYAAKASAAVAPVQLPAAALRIQKLTATSVGEPKLEGTNVSCCLDCEELLPMLRAVEQAASDWAKPMAPSALRDDAAYLRSVPWETHVPETYEKKTRAALITAFAGVAAALDSTAAEAEASEGRGKSVGKAVGAAVGKLIAAAGKLGEESQFYCGAD